MLHASTRLIRAKDMGAATGPRTGDTTGHLITGEGTGHMMTGDIADNKADVRMCGGGGTSVHGGGIKLCCSGGKDPNPVPLGVKAGSDLAAMTCLGPVVPVRLSLGRDLLQGDCDVTSPRLTVSRLERFLVILFYFILFYFILIN